MATWTSAQEFDFLIAKCDNYCFIVPPLDIFSIMPVIKYKLISVITDSFQQALVLRYKVLNDSCWNNTGTE